MTTENLLLVNDTVSLTGAITFYNAPALCQQLLDVLPKDHAFIIDLQKVTQCDSASIVVLLQILRFAKQHKQSVKFINMPKAMKTLSELYDLASVFKN